MRTEKENRNTNGNRNDSKGIEEQKRHERNRATDKINVTYDAYVEVD